MRLTARGQVPPTVRVWDGFVRAFHWSLVTLVAIAFLSPDAHALHEPIGYVVVALVAARVVWGLVGSRHARFASFVVGPRAVLRYLATLRHGRAPRHLGHNPAGAVMIVAMLGLLAVVGASGWLSETDAYFGVPWVSHLHALTAHLLLVLIGLHVAGVLVSSILHRENLVVAMLTGVKRADAAGWQRDREAATAAGTRGRLG